jgi:hypothetical protein
MPHARQPSLLHRQTRQIVHSRLRSEFAENDKAALVKPAGAVQQILIMVSEENPLRKQVRVSHVIA